FGTSRAGVDLLVRPLVRIDVSCRRKNGQAPQEYADLPIDVRIDRTLAGVLQVIHEVGVAVDCDQCTTLKRKRNVGAWRKSRREVGRLVRRLVEDVRIKTELLQLKRRSEVDPAEVHWRVLARLIDLFL